jgi:hypothetical protein
MIGWARRDDEGRRRRAAWLATLTPEERRDEADYQDYAARVWFRSAPLFFLGWTLLLLLAGSESAHIGRAPAIMIGISLLPGSMTCPFFLCVMTKRAWLAARRRCTAGDE